MTDQQDPAIQQDPSGSGGRGTGDRDTGDRDTEHGHLQNGSPGGEQTSQRSFTDDPTVRWSALGLAAAAAGLGAVTGAVSLLFTFAVLVPVLAAWALTLRGLDVWSRWARIAAVAGFTLWLGLTGGLAMILVVAMVILMIFLHELGHYLTARHAGMKVTEFFLGFGTRLWSFRRGETEFGVKAIPAGAYVKIIGMNNLEEVDPADEARTYRRAPFRHRLSVAFAGSGMHFALALVLLMIQFSVFGRVEDSRWVIGDLTEGGAAQQAGLHSGDKVVAFEGEPVGTFDEFRDQIVSASGVVTVEVQRDGETLTVPVDLIKRAKIIGTVGTDVDVLQQSGGLFVGPLVDNSRPERAGLATGQRILEVNGRPLDELAGLDEAVEASSDGAVHFTVADVSSDATHEATVDLGTAVATTEPTTFLGVGVEHTLQPVPIPQAVGSSVTSFADGVTASVVGIVKVFNPPQLMEFLGNTITGDRQDVAAEPTPAAQVAVSSDASRPTSIIGAIAYGAELTGEDFSNLIAFMIMLNIFIGVFNLIPLLPFDGGHVAIACYEKVREVASGSKKRYVADITRMIPVAYGVVMVLAVVGLLAVYLDLTVGVSA